MRNFMFIFMPVALGIMMYLGGGFATVASWLLILFGVQGVLTALVVPTVEGGKLRESLRSRNLFFYLSSEALTFYALYMCISYGWLIIAFIYIIGMLAEFSAVLYAKRIKD